MFHNLPPGVKRPTREKRWIFGVTFTFVSGLVTAYRMYKSYTFNNNVEQTLHYLLGNQTNFQKNILSNKKYLLSLLRLLLVISKIYIQTYPTLNLTHTTSLMHT